MFSYLGKQFSINKRMNRGNLIQSRRFRRIDRSVYTLREVPGVDVYAWKYWRYYRTWVVNNRMGFKHVLACS
jgi:hypothetical protein